jgi:hypothetical protein
MNSVYWNLRLKISIQIYSLSLLGTFHTFFKYVLLALLLLLRDLFVVFFFTVNTAPCFLMTNFFTISSHFSNFTFHFLVSSFNLSGETLLSQGSLEAHDEES